MTTATEPSHQPAAMAALIYDWNTRGHRGPLSPLVDRKVSFFDETLRDGLQSPSVRDPSIEDKREILRLGASLGIDAFDLGLPGAGPHAVKDVAALIEYAEKEKLGIEYACAARTHKADIDAVAEVAQRTGKSINVYAFLGSSPIRQYAEDWNVELLVERTVMAADLCKSHGLPMTFVTEDTTRTPPAILDRLFRAAVDHGVARLCLCDTVGHVTPEGVGELVGFARTVLESISATHVGVDWHGHNDRGLGVVNNLRAIAAGADRIHGTALGVGERVGNAALDQTLMNLKIMGELEGRDLTNLVPWCRKVAAALGVTIPGQYPLVGDDAFRTATGVHAAAVIKAIRKGDVELADRIYSGVPAGWFGKQQAIEIGFMSGESNVVFWLQQRGIEPDARLVKHIFEVAKSTRHVLTDDEVNAAIATHRAGAR